MLPTIFESGMDDYAYRMLCNEELPGWLYAVNLGATTIWERWNSVLPNGTRDTRGAGGHHWRIRPAEDYLYPFSRSSFLYDILRCPAARALEQSAPGLYATAAGENPEFLTMTVEAIAHIPMWETPVDLAAVDRALKTVSV